MGFGIGLSDAGSATAVAIRAKIAKQRGENMFACALCGDAIRTEAGAGGGGYILPAVSA